MTARLRLDRSGASAVEFAMVLPLLLIFLFGIIDTGRLLWTWNRAEKATQMAVRYAVVTDMVPSTLASRDFALNGGVVGGNPVPDCTSGSPPGCFDSTTCDNSSCSGSWGYNSTAFGFIAQRVRFFLPQAQPANVRVRYENVGLGFAGDPNGPDVAPLVTVSVTNLQFQPSLFALFGASIALPDFQASLTAEDSACEVISGSPSCISN